MASLPVVSGRQCCAALSKVGFVKVRQKGSHIVMQKQLPGTTITIPVPDHKELATGTLRSIIR
jgi:predicted RNA binding protein YcfA (HicA-like mRNA interferase family)